MESMLDKKKQEHSQECLICKEEKQKGIHLLTYFICKNCEKNVVESVAEDDDYQHYVEQLRKVRDQLIPINSRRLH
ncbi:sigma factor G inhibitor Gin [Bacillus shivajii]|uniref:sigma factor G inhibitor Gin n=1 Tax=Bacillus shivajii TaxID=1983719 RepID=UPI001CFC3D05|nr:sigma factor G inhibitor Gin [Bacillus shivajii]UCZ53287.1 sigma factor G inhibitor Gin [Bacillus shivajii]